MIKDAVCEPATDEFINQKIETESFKHKGKLSLQNGLKAKYIVLTGKINIDGGLIGYNFNGTGSIQILGNVLSKSINIKGSLDGFHKIKAEEVKILGSITGEGITAKIIDITFSNESAITTIEGEKVTILKQEGTNTADSIPFVNELLSKLFQKEIDMDFSKIETVEDFIFSAEKITGKTVVVEHTKCKHIEGDRIIIGPGCQIDTIHYRESLEIDPSSHVITNIQR